MNVNVPWLCSRETGLLASPLVQSKWGFPMVGVKGNDMRKSSKRNEFNTKSEFLENVLIDIDRGGD